MIAAWMGHALAASLLLAAAAAVADRGLRLAGRPTRGLWLAALLLAVAVPPLAWWRAASTPPSSPVAAAAAPAAGGSGGIALDALLARATVAVAPTDTLARLDRPLLALWALLAAGALGRLALAQRRLRRARREWRAATVDGAPVLVAGRTGPAVAGLLRPAVVLPEWALGADPAVRRLMLAHEREHLRARDPLLLGAAALVVALAPWNLPLHWLLRRLRLAVEIDCDRRVLARHPDVRRYGALLLEVGRRTPAADPLPLAALSSTATSLERRIHTMTMPRPRHPHVRALLLAASSAAIAAIALLAPHPAVRAAAAQEPAAPAIEREEGSDDRIGRARALVRERFPELADSATGARRILYVAERSDGTIEFAVYGRAPAAGEPRPEMPVRVDPAAIAEVYVEKTEAGVVTTDPLDLVWMVLRADADPAAFDTTSGRRGDSVPRPTILRPGAGAPEPLYVIDGVVVEQDGRDVVADLDPDRIESIEVLKGAAARDLHGERGANGVVSITMKKPGGS